MQDSKRLGPQAICYSLTLIHRFQYSMTIAKDPEYTSLVVKRFLH